MHSPLHPPEAACHVFALIAAGILHDSVLEHALQVEHAKQFIKEKFVPRLRGAAHKVPLCCDTTSNPA